MFRNAGTDAAQHPVSKGQAIVQSMPSLVSGESIWCTQITSGLHHIVASSPRSFTFTCALEETSSTNRDRGCGPRANLHKADQTFFHIQLPPTALIPVQPCESNLREMKRLFQDEDFQLIAWERGIKDGSNTIDTGFTRCRGASRYVLIDRSSLK